MKELFGWLKKSDNHLLIKSCVFHYEFEFMLNEILSTLKKRQGESLKKWNDDTANNTVSGIVNLIKSNPVLKLAKFIKAINALRESVRAH